MIVYAGFYVGYWQNKQAVSRSERNKSKILHPPDEYAVILALRTSVSRLKLSRTFEKRQ
jgi:hypothetical protein